MRRRIISSPDDNRELLDRTPVFEIGVCITHPPGSNRADIRLGDRDTKVIRKVIVPNRMRVRTGDNVVITKMPGVDSWLALNCYDTTRESGRNQGDVGTFLQMPESLAAANDGNIYVWTWYVNCWTVPILYHLQVNTSPISVDATEHRTWQNQWTEISVNPLYARVRAMYISPYTDGFYYGPWTSWVS